MQNKSKNQDLDRAKVVNQNFLDIVAKGTFPKLLNNLTIEQAKLSPHELWQLFTNQVHSRLIDLLARDLKQKNQGFYTIGSSGHESNAAIAKAFRVTDPAFLHYRSQAFLLARACQFGLEQTKVLADQILALLAKKQEPVNSGRHKVIGSKVLNIIPQTSTIASHSPKALGMAFAINLAKNLKKDQANYPHDAVSIISFGDGSLNHSTMQGSLNAASWILKKTNNLPLVFVCEDNNIAISVKNPENWVKESISSKSGLKYIFADGLNILDVYLKAKQAAQIARDGQPVFLHIKTVRLMGHAGSDIEQHYNSLANIKLTEANDPLLYTANILINQAGITNQQIIDFYLKEQEKIKQLAVKLMDYPALSSAKDVMASLIPSLKTKELKLISNKFLADPKREQIFAEDYKYLTKARSLAQNLNYALTDLMLEHPEIIIFGEDVAKKGGVYRITANLQKRFGAQRVFDTLLDEQTILGTAIGLAHNGFLPIPEIQFLAYTHNAVDQIRGEAATMSFFSNGQYTNPMVIRIAGLGYQKGFGGHFHNDNAIGFLREIPGLVIACPSNPKMAVKLLRQSINLAKHQQRVVVFLEPIALYHSKELKPEIYQAALLEKPLELGQLSLEGDLKAQSGVLSYANGMQLAREVSTQLAADNIRLKLIDLCWLAPLNIDNILKAIKGLEKLYIIDEGRKTGSISEQITTLIYENLDNNNMPQIIRITGEDSFIPIGNSWQYVLPSKEQIKNIILQTEEVLEKAG